MVTRKALGLLHSELTIAIFKNWFYNCTGSLSFPGKQFQLLFCFVYFNQNATMHALLFSLPRKQLSTSSIILCFKTTPCAKTIRVGSGIMLALRASIAIKLYCDTYQFSRVRSVAHAVSISLFKWYQLRYRHRYYRTCRT